MIRRTLIAALLATLLVCQPVWASRLFNGTTDTVLWTIGSGPSLGDYTASVWVQKNGAGSGVNTVIAMYDATYINYFQLRVNETVGGSGVEGCWVIQGGAASCTSGNTNQTCTTTSPCHLSLVRSSGGMILYLNDQVLKSISGQGTHALLPIALQAGAFSVTNFCNCTISEIGVWSMALNAAEIASLGTSQPSNGATGGTGVSPWLVEREHLVFYATLHGIHSPEISMEGKFYSGVATGTTLGANHAPVGQIPHH